MGFLASIWFGLDWYMLINSGPSYILTYFDTHNVSVWLDEPLLILQSNKNILDFQGFVTLIYSILETCNYQILNSLEAPFKT